MFKKHALKIKKWSTEHWHNTNWIYINNAFFSSNMWIKQ